MITLLKRIVVWIEKGDLIPLILGISIPHYVSVLLGYDAWYVAVSIGTLVDITHYRSVKLALRSGGWPAWAWVTVLTVGVFGFHFWFYLLQNTGVGGAILLGGMPPLLIGFLAFMTRKEKLDDKLSQSISQKQDKKQVLVDSKQELAEIVAELVAKAQAEQKLLAQEADKLAQPEQELATYSCPACGKKFGTPQARGAHFGHFPDHNRLVSKNGEHEPEQELMV